jgi:hypothetical protein
MSSDPSPTRVVGWALGKGCLAGLALVALYGAIGGLVYLALGWLGAASNLRMLVGIASGPIVGTAIALIVALAVVQRTAPPPDDGAAP